jgi:hypothetical protein
LRTSLAMRGSGVRVPLAPHSCRTPLIRSFRLVGGVSSCPGSILGGPLRRTRRCPSWGVSGAPRSRPQDGRRHVAADCGRATDTVPPASGRWGQPNLFGRVSSVGPSAADLSLPPSASAPSGKGCEWPCASGAVDRPATASPPPGPHVNTPPPPGSAGVAPTGEPARSRALLRRSATSCGCAAARGTSTRAGPHTAAPPLATAVDCRPQYSAVEGRPRQPRATRVGEHELEPWRRRRAGRNRDQRCRGAGPRAHPTGTPSTPP